jgi:hypothetical protein
MWCKRNYNHLIISSFFILFDERTKNSDERKSIATLFHWGPAYCVTDLLKLNNTAGAGEELLSVLMTLLLCCDP